MKRRRSQVVARLRERILDGIHLGSLRSGEKLPSVRAIACECGIDPRVALAAYRELEAEGLVELRRRSGVYVAGAAAASALGSRRRTDWIVSAYHDGVRHGVTATDLPDVLRHRMIDRPLRAVCAECNHDQIEALRASLEGDFGFETAALDCGGAPPERHWREQLREIDLLVTTQFHAHELKVAAQEARVPLLTVGLRPRFLLDVRRLLAAGPVYLVLLDPRLAEKMKRLLAPTGKTDRLHILDVSSPGFSEDFGAIPRGAPTFVTQAARQRLTGSRLPGAVEAEVATLTPDSVRSILSFIIRVRARDSAGNAPSGGAGRRRQLESDRRLRLGERRRQVVKVEYDLRG